MILDCVSNIIFSVSLVEESVNLQLLFKVVILLLSVWMPFCCSCLKLMRSSSLKCQKCSSSLTDVCITLRVWAGVSWSSVVMVLVLLSRRD